jgi:hypothetical protein
METNKQTGAHKWFHPDVPRAVRNHLLGDKHSPKHKFIFGSFIMLFGISIVKGSLFVDSFILHFLADGVGYLLHGVGAIPIIKSIEEGGKS